MSKSQNIKNGGFPPIKYCSTITLDKEQKTSKERFFSNVVKQNINIRQLLVDTQKKPIIITETVQDDNLEVLDSL
jgi:hypothetical protein